MIGAIIEEIKLTPLYSPMPNITINTIYFGGGTPSILIEDDLQKILNALNNKFVFANDAEITLEANPDDINTEKLDSWKRAGINRLSVGIQSFLNEELKWMNRAHTAEESLACIELIKRAGFSNFSADLIYGSPLLSDDNWKINVDKMIASHVPHLSCYALTVEPDTALYNMIEKNNKLPVDPDKQANQFLLLMQWLKNAGYEHYEISNFAKPGFRSRHNSSYWTHTDAEHTEPYYAFGPAAHSLSGNTRRWNIANNALYIQSLENNIIPFEEEKLTPTEQLNEYIMTSLRTTEGLSLDYVSKIFGDDLAQEIRKNIYKFEESGRIIVTLKRVTLTDSGKLFADGIAADLFF